MEHSNWRTFQGLSSTFKDLLCFQGFSRAWNFFLKFKYFQGLLKDPMNPGSDYCCYRSIDHPGCLQIWKIKFPKVSGFSRPSKRFFTRQLWSKNTDLTNHLSSQFGSFLAHRIFYLRCMMTGSIHASHCVTQPNYSTCYRKLCCQLDVQEIGLMSYNNKAAFKNVDKQHMLYCNTVTICDNIIFPE